MKSWQTYSMKKNKAFLSHETSQKKRWILLTILLCMTFVTMVFSIALGSVKLHPKQVLEVLAGLDRTSTAAKIVLYSRLPHVCAAMLSGTALAVSGAVIQTVLNNPLASPGIIGVNSSAGLSVAVICAIAPWAQRYTPLVAFLGGIIGVFLIMGLSFRTGASKMTVVLAGVAVSNLFSAGIDAVVTLVPEALNGVSDFRIGGFSNVSMPQLLPAGGMIFLSLLVVLSLSQQMDILALGSDIAQSLGLSVKPLRILLLILAAALAGAAVSFAGLLGFVGLIVPHSMRRLVGADSLPLLLSSALGGAFFVLLCDLLARMLFAPYELPVGIVLAFTGAPFFLWLLFKQKGGRL